MSSAERRTGAVAWNTMVALADDAGHPFVDGAASTRTGRMWCQWRCSWILTASWRIDFEVVEVVEHEPQ